MQSRLLLSHLRRSIVSSYNKNSYRIIAKQRRLFCDQVKKSSSEFVAEVAEEDLDDEQDDQGEYLGKQNIHVAGTQEEFEKQIDEIMKDPEVADKFETAMQTPKIQQLLKMLESI